MFAVACGEHAVDLVQRASERAGAAPERDGPLAITGAQGTTHSGWHCWLSGRLTNDLQLCERFGLPADTSPTELLARMYSQLGEDACELLRGTFIVVALNREQAVATVVRDQLGGRPLVYTRVGSGALLAEHERAIVDALAVTPNPDRLVLAQWIDRGSTPPDCTLFESIRRIPPAHRARLSRDSVAVEPYWHPRYQGIASGSHAEIAYHLRDAAFAAVGRAAQEAQTPAVLLSGGLDSSCVAAGLAARPQPTSRAIALSGIFPSHPDTDERELIEATAHHTDLPVDLIAFDERASILAPALKHIDRWSLPPVTPNLFVWEPVTARARELGVDAMLDGEGGDELFAWAPYLIADMLRNGRMIAAWRLTRCIPGVGDEAGVQMRLRALRLWGTSRLLPTSVRQRRRHRRAAEQLTRSLLQKADLLALVKLEDDSRPPTLDGPMWWRELAATLTRPGETLGVSAHLRREAVDERIDRRHPFLFDLDLLAIVLTTPPRMQFEVRDRALIRDGLSSHIPEIVRTRCEKSYFNSMLSTGLSTDGPLLTEGLFHPDAPVRAFVRSQALQTLLREGPTPSNGRTASRLWRVGLADAWLRSLESPEHSEKLLATIAARGLPASAR